MTPWVFVRTYILTPPFSAAAFSLFWLCGVLVYPFDPDKSKAQWVARVFSKMLLWTAGVSIQVEGMDRLRSGGPFVLVSNHLSLADTPLMAVILPMPFRYFAKESLMNAPIIGGHLKRGGHLSVTREDTRSAARSLAQAIQVMRDTGASMLIFAEGSRSTEGLLPFEPGAAYLAIKAKVPVVPLAIQGTREALPKGAPLLRPAKVVVRVGEPIDTSGMKPSDRESLTEMLQERVSKMLGQ